MRLEHARRGDGEPLVLLHGIGDSARLWNPVLPLLAVERECWALDLPGFGHSAALPAGVEPTPAALARAVIEFMSAEGHGTFHVSGNSLGGAVALELGRTGAARSVTALSPVGFAEGRERLLLETSLRATHRAAVLAFPSVGRVPLPALVRRFALAQMVFRGQRVPPDELADLIKDLALSPGWDTTLPAMLAYRFSGELDCPVTIAWGERDRLLLFHPQSARARERLPGARHITLVGCGHLPTWDDPDQVARVLLDASVVPAAA
jgi:pimeloyl-ACP methyl ester carboxylesterase